MKVLVASTFVPFIRGGGRMIVDDLVGALRERGHEVDTALIPFWSDARVMAEQMLSLRLTDVTAGSDVLVAIRTPSYLLRHPHKRVWFIHHHRPAYDLWGTEHQDVPDTPAGLRLRAPILQADELALREAEYLFTNSMVVSDRLMQFNGLDSEVLYPPLPNSSAYSAGPYGDYVFYPSRITLIKRQELLVRALAETSSDVRLVLAGNPDAPEHLRSLERLIEELEVAERVELHAGWISEEQKRELFAGALACAYVPYDEDSYGYVSLEAFHSRRPVITCTDSGGTLELIEHRRSGLVVEPEAPALAAAMDELREDPTLAPRLGEAAFSRIGELEISWDRVVEKLLG